MCLHIFSTLYQEVVSKFQDVLNSKHSRGNNILRHRYLHLGLKYPWIVKLLPFLLNGKGQRNMKTSEDELGARVGQQEVDGLCAGKKDMFGLKGIRKGPHPETWRRTSFILFF